MIWRRIKEITAGVESHHLPENESLIINHLLTDSRLLKSSKGTLFFAISGKQNGHHYIEELYEKGVRFFIIEENLKNSTYPEASILKVENSVQALQAVARFHREELNLLSIGITGSNGKTTIKEWLSSMLSTEKAVIKTPKSYNSQIGVPLSVWNATKNHEVGVFEAGISQVGEMTKLQKVLQPQIGILTNIGPAHAAGFDHIEQKIAEKALLFSDAKVIVCCREHDAVYTHLSEQYPAKILDWSFTKDSAKVRVVQSDGKLKLTSKDYEHSFETPFELSIWTENCLHAIVVALHLDISPKSIQAAIQDLQPVKMRLTIKKGMRGCYIIDDTYNNDLNGLEVALDYLKLQKQREKKTVILSEFLDAVQDEIEVATLLKEMMTGNRVSRLLLVGSWTKRNFNNWPFPVTLFSSKRDLLHKLPVFENEMILVKGARKFAFEDVVNRLSEKSHRTHLEINFEALIHNLSSFKQKVNPNVKVLAMVKAFGYGGGGAEISNLLQFHNIDYLGVAYTDEAIQLRSNGITRPILVLNPDFERSREMSELGIEPEVYSLSTLDRVIQEEHPPAIHLKIETGMNRLGLIPQEWEVAAKALQRNPEVRVAGIFTHLSSAEEKASDRFSRNQISAFEAAYDLFHKAIGYRPLKHVVNSAGIIRFPEYHFDMIRLGVGLYGYDPTNQLSLRPVGRLVTYVSQVKAVEAGDFVGYNRKGKATDATTIAVLPIGYADGYNRRFGKGSGKVIWNGIKLPTIGNICMDMTMIDTLGHRVQEGDEIEIFGHQQSITELAEQIGTIPYEILTSISERVVRFYQSE